MNRSTARSASRNWAADENELSGPHTTLNSTPGKVENFCHYSFQTIPIRFAGHKPRRVFNCTADAISKKFDDSPHASPRASPRNSPRSNEFYVSVFVPASMVIKSLSISLRDARRCLVKWIAVSSILIMWKRQWRLLRDGHNTNLRYRYCWGHAVSTINFTSDLTHLRHFSYCFRS